MGVVALATKSAVRFPRLAAHYELHLRHGRLGICYDLPGRGRYQVFRETTSAHLVYDPTVLVVGFRLKLINDNHFMHRLFQRVCVLTTPFWSGFPGFGTKLWMFDPATHIYLGIYQWDTPPAAKVYVNALTRVLKAVSTKGSVWHELYTRQRLEIFLLSHRAPSVA